MSILLKPRPVAVRAALCFILTVFIAVIHPSYAQAQDYVPLVSPSVILMEQQSGKVLYAKNENARMYPASMTKMLTSLVALDYMSMDDVVTIGNEIYGMPPGYNTQLHFEGETITVRNLIRALMIRSGNETGCILALNTIRAMEERQKIPYDEAERLFCQMMTEKARLLGALDSNFTNPYGLHDENHYTTAYDLALVARAFMENEELREIVSTRVYTGDSLEGNFYEGARVQEYTWETHNELLLGGPNGYPYATGIKTGFTDQAGHCLAASASKLGVELVAVIFFSPDPGRWQDARLLFEYGFETFAYETIQEKDVVLETMTVANPRLGESDLLEVLADETAVDFLSKAELSRLEKVITYDEAFIAPPDPESADPSLKLLAPIEKGEKLGTVTYLLDGAVIFEGTFRAAADIAERNFDSDTDYYVAQFKGNIFSMKALPYWFGGVGTLIGIIGITAAIAGRRGRRRDYWRKSNGRYNGLR